MTAASSSSDLGADLVRWFRRCRRDLPWRRRRDPYRTWVSEMMLQQTTVEVVAPRFEDFVRRWPNVESLAAAEEDDVVRAWAGLGYYRRARALHQGARTVVREHAGRIPRGEDELRGLPGVGPYTAAAIRALGFNEPAGAVDGNIARVMARLLADAGEITSAVTRRRLGAALVQVLPVGEAGLGVEAAIELGALVCRPRDPACGDCPVAGHCAARREDRVHELPVKRKAAAPVPVQSDRAMVERGGRLLLVQRPADATLLPGFWELPGRWSPPGADPAEVLGEVLGELGFGTVRIGESVAAVRHAITRHRIQARAWEARVRGSARRGGPGRFAPLATLDPGTLTTETRKLLARAGRGR